MLKRNLIRIFAVTMIIFMAYSVSFGDIRIRFARGRTSATMSGSLRGGGVVCYVAGARDGQTLSATVSSRNGRVDFLDMNSTSYSEFMKFTGDHRLCISNNGRTTRYTLTVSIR